MKIFKGPSYDELYLFFLQLGVYYEGGNPIKSAIETLQDQTSNSVLKEALKNMLRDMVNGANLALATQKQECFPKVCARVIEAGEESGTLETSLEETAMHMHQNADILRRIRTAVLPVAISMVLMILTVITIIIFVIPYFEQLYAGMQSKMPAYTVFVVNMCHLLTRYWYMDILAILAVILGIKLYSVKNPFIWDVLLLKIPIYKKIHFYYLQGKFTRIFLMLIGSGFNSLLSLEYTAEAVGNEVMARVLRKAITSIRNGYSLSAALKINNTGIIDKPLIDLIKTGEENATLEQTLKKAEKYYKNLTESKTQTFETEISPWLYGPAALLIIGIVIAVQLPIWMMSQGV